MDRMLYYTIIMFLVISYTFNNAISVANEIEDAYISTDIDSQYIGYVIGNEEDEVIDPSITHTFPKLKKKPYPIDLDNHPAFNSDKDYVLEEMDVDNDTSIFTGDYPTDYYIYPSSYSTGDPLLRERISSRYVIDEIKLLPLDIAQELVCLSLNIYHEARGSLHADQVSTAFVVMNRVDLEEFPDNVCGVVWEYYIKRKGGYIAQFSWTRDGFSDVPRTKSSWIIAQKLAYLVYFNMIPNVIGNRLNYFAHNSIDTPHWARSANDSIIVGSHTYLTAEKQFYLSDKP